MPLLEILKVELLRFNLKIVTPEKETLCYLCK